MLESKQTSFWKFNYQISISAGHCRTITTINYLYDSVTLSEDQRLNWITHNTVGLKVDCILLFQGVKLLVTGTVQS